jgi:hypothetical protein
MTSIVFSDVRQYVIWLISIIFNVVQNILVKTPQRLKWIYKLEDKQTNKQTKYKITFF